MIGKLILNYKIISILGEGGMGIVYLAEHTKVNRKVAIKILLPQYLKNEEVKNRFKNEASFLAELNHPNIVKLLDYTEDEFGLYLIMDLVEGTPLDEYIANVSGAIPYERAIPIMQKVLSAFSYAHSKGIIHRDIKPSNIIIGKDDEIKILDFGIAKILDQENKSFTKTGSQMGTVFYMSPEQVQGKVLDTKSDIYSLGITFYQILTGLNPYQDLTIEYIIHDKIVNEALPNPKEIYPGIPDFLCAIIEKAIQKSPEDRFTDCDEFQLAIKEKKTILTKTKLDSPSPNNLGQTKTTLDERDDIIIKEPIKKWILGIGIALVLILLFFLLLRKSEETTVLHINFVSDHAISQQNSYIPLEIQIFADVYEDEVNDTYYLPVVSFKRIDIEYQTDTLIFSKSVYSDISLEDANTMYENEILTYKSTFNMFSNRQLSEFKSLDIDRNGIRYFYLDLSGQGKSDGNVYFNDAKVLHNYILDQLKLKKLFNSSQKPNTISIILLSGDGEVKEEIVTEETGNFETIESEVTTEENRGGSQEDSPVVTTEKPKNYNANLSANGNSIKWNSDLVNAEKLTIKFTSRVDKNVLVEEDVTGQTNFNFSYSNSIYTDSRIIIELFATFSNGSKISGNSITVNNLNCH